MKQFLATVGQMLYQDKEHLPAGQPTLGSTACGQSYALHHPGSPLFLPVQIIQSMQRELLLQAGLICQPMPSHFFCSHVAPIILKPSAAKLRL